MSSKTEFSKDVLKLDAAKAVEKISQALRDQVFGSALR